MSKVFCYYIFLSVPFTKILPILIFPFAFFQENSNFIKDLRKKSGHMGFALFLGGHFPDFLRNESRTPQKSIS
jgi:hypothetical protein